jgi:hypothetical protein
VSIFDGTVNRDRDVQGARDASARPCALSIAQ